MKRRIIILSKLLLRHFEKNPHQGFAFFCGVSLAIVSGSIIIALFAGVGLYEAIFKFFIK
jgi:hypothetical protein